MSEFTPWSALAGGALIGLSATLLLSASGRVAGVSGIVNGLLNRGSRGAWHVAFIAGVVLGAGPLLWSGFGRADLPAGGSAWLPVAAGLLVGFGSTMGNGCTSGHGVCGIARFSMRSLVATLVFVASAMVTVFLTRHAFA